jgi:FAD/FMN-containing dehydrogenase
MTTSTVEIRQTEGDTLEFGSQELIDLEGELGGRILFPGDDGFAEATLTWNGMVAATPAVVVQPRSARDVAAVVDFAREREVLVSMRGGGHNIAGTSIAPDGLTIDMSLMREVSVDPDRRLVHAGPGCVLGDVDAATQQHGLATVLGFVSETGLAGLTLGGGWGYLTRRFGWTVDNLEEVEIVTADGQIRVANRDSNDDLFWAVRGGGGNFGVVTRFTYRLHEVGPTITAGLVAWSADRAAEILGAYREITAAAPRELTLATVVRMAPPAPFVPEEWHGRPIVAMVACFTGDDPERALRPIRRLPEPVVDTIGPMPYAGLQTMLNANEPKGPHRYWKTEFLPDLADGFLEAFREGAYRQTTPISQSVIFHLGGALNDRAADDGAVGNRDARYIAGFSGTWPPDAPAEPHIRWVRESWETIRPYSTGGNYVNFQQGDDDEVRLEAAYGDNYRRLRAVKGKYDPDNFLRMNRNIPPAG